MRSLIQPTVLGLVLLTVVMAGPALAESKVLVAPEKVEKLDLADAYATFDQPGVQKLSHTMIELDGKMIYEQPYGYQLNQIRKGFQSGASDVFLVVGDDITEAVMATRDVLVGGRPADRLTRLLDDGPEGGQRVWVVAYLGISGSEPPAWSVQAVTLSNRNNVVIHTQRGQAQTNDRQPYLMLLPLPRVDAAMSYSLELREADTKKTTLLRSVAVGEEQRVAPPAPAVNPRKLQGGVGGVAPEPGHDPNLPVPPPKTPDQVQADNARKLQLAALKKQQLERQREQAAQRAAAAAQDDAGLDGEVVAAAKQADAILVAKVASIEMGPQGASDPPYVTMTLKFGKDAKVIKGTFDPTEGLFHGGRGVRVKFPPDEAFIFLLDKIRKDDWRVRQILDATEVNLASVEAAPKKQAARDIRHAPEEHKNLPPELGPISELDVEVKKDASLYKHGGASKPHEIKSLKDAEPYFDDAALKEIEEAVDFNRQVLLVFTWAGSGQDKLTYEVAESMPEQVTFKYTRGKTRDRRGHTKVFVLRSDVTWRVDPEAR